MTSKVIATRLNETALVGPPDDSVHRIVSISRQTSLVVNRKSVARRVVNIRHVLGVYAVKNSGDAVEWIILVCDQIPRIPSQPNLVSNAIVS